MNGSVQDLPQFREVAFVLLLYRRRFLLPVQIAVKIKCRADQRQVSQRLREITERLALVPDLLAVKAQMVGVSRHLLKQQARPPQAFGIVGTGAGKSFAHQKRNQKAEAR